MNMEQNNLESKIKNLQKTQISQDKFIINKSELINAKSLALFPSDSIMPLTLDNEKDFFKCLKLSFEIELSRDKENHWAYEIYSEGVDFRSRSLCNTNGILINPTQEQIDERIKQRVSEFRYEWTKYTLYGVPDEYLTQELLKKKHDYLKQNKVTTNN